MKNYFIFLFYLLFFFTPIKSMKRIGGYSDPVRRQTSKLYRSVCPPPHFPPSPFQQHCLDSGIPFTPKRQRIVTRDASTQTTYATAATTSTEFDFLKDNSDDEEEFIFEKLINDMTICAKIDQLDRQILYLKEEYNNTIFANDIDKLCFIAEEFKELAIVFSQKKSIVFGRKNSKEAALNFIVISKGFLDVTKLLNTKVKEGPDTLLKKFMSSVGKNLAINFYNFGGIGLLSKKATSIFYVDSDIFNSVSQLSPAKRLEETVKLIVINSIECFCYNRGLRFSPRIAEASKRIFKGIINNKFLAESFVESLRLYVQNKKKRGI